MGTAEFYAVVEAFDSVADSLVIDNGELLCFLVLAEGVSIEDVEGPCVVVSGRSCPPGTYRTGSSGSRSCRAR